MVDGYAFLRGKADKQRRARLAAARQPSASGSSLASGSGPAPIVNPRAVDSPTNVTPGVLSSTTATSSSGSSGPSRPTATGAPWNPANVVKIKLFSSGDLGGIRYNVMRMNHEQDVDPRMITEPVLFNRKPRGGQDKPYIAYDAEGTPVGKFVYDNAGKPVLGADGEHVVEIASGPDLSLVGGVGIRKKNKKATVRETYAGDAEAYRTRREEAEPWVLESGNAEANRKDEEVKAEGVKPEQGVKREYNGGRSFHMPERWVGMMQEAQQTKTVLIVDNGSSGFNVLPLGRTYLFNPKRPFDVPDVDVAHKRYEQAARTQTKDLWANREGGPGRASQAMVVEYRRQQMLGQWERNADKRAGKANRPKVKTERFEDDFRREGRQLERGMEGGEDEELDYDVNEDFQDDEDNNNFHRNEEEEEEQKRIEEQQRKEFKIANATVGDRPQIEEDDDGSDDDLFGDKLNTEGKRLRKAMKKRGEYDDMYDSDEDEDSEDEEEETKKNEEAAKKAEEKNAQADRLPRPPSRNASDRRTESPRRQRPIPLDQASTAPPGSGAAYLAQRAAAASPRRKARTHSPTTGRGQSPENDSRGGSPGASVRGSSPVSARGGSPGPSQSQREGTPTGAASRSGPTNGTPNKKRKQSTASPTPSLSAPGTPGSSGSTADQPPKPSSSGPAPPGAHGKKRKTSPLANESMGTPGGIDEARKKTKQNGSAHNTASPSPAPDMTPFPGMISRESVHQWFRQNGKQQVPMSAVIKEFKASFGTGETLKKNQANFLAFVKEVTSQQPGVKGMLIWHDGRGV